VRELADGLLDRGDRPSLITSHPGWPSRVLEDGLAVLRLPRPPQGPLLRRGYEPYLTHLPLSYLALRLGSYDLAHAVYPPDALAAVRWKRRTGRPVVLSYLGIPDQPGLTEFRRRRDVVIRALRGCDAVIALSRYAARAFEQSLGYEARVISPGVNLDVFRPLPARAAQPTIVCSAAVEVERKNMPLLAQAFRLVRRQRAGARLILSRPSDPAAAARAAVDLETPGLEWADLNDRAVLASANGEAWVAALPSRYEAFGLVLIEALACGTPVVGFDEAAIPEVIDRPEIGRLFDQLEPEPLARALLEALELAEAPGTGPACRARAEEFSTQRCAAEYRALYSELL
jgi:glycosyltransferase involved in cell wall biosynthesis